MQIQFTKIQTSQTQNTAPAQQIAIQAPKTSTKRTFSEGSETGVSRRRNHRLGIQLQREQPGEQLREQPGEQSVSRMSKRLRREQHFVKRKHPGSSQEQPGSSQGAARSSQEQPGKPARGSSQGSQGTFSKRL